jgi:chemotaxis protein MotA
LALLVALGALVAVLTLVDDAPAFFDLPSALVTIGGTAVVTLLSFPRAQLVALVAVVREALRERGPERPVEQVKMLARAYRMDGIAGLEAAGGSIENPYLRRGIDVVMTRQESCEVREILAGEHVRRVGQYEDSRRILSTIGKLLPAFGLIGTLVGLVVLLKGGENFTMAHIGPGLSLAILTTLYGAVLANGVVLPLDAKLQSLTDHQRLRFEIGVRGAELIAERAYPSVIEERLGGLEPVDTMPTEAPVARDSAAAALSSLH